MLKISKAQVAHLISVPIVAVLTVGTAWLAKHFPGLPPLSNEIVAGAGLLVGTFAAGVALHYLKGLREWEVLEAEGVISTTDEAPEQALAAEDIPPQGTPEQALAALPEGSAPPSTEGGAPGGGE